MLLVLMQVQPFVRIKRRSNPLHLSLGPPLAGILDIQSPTTARWRWHRNNQGFAQVGECPAAVALQ